MRGCSCSSHTYIRLWCTAVQPWPVCIAAQSVGERVLCSPWLPVEAAASFSAGLADSAACSAAAGSVAAAARLIRCHGLARSGSWHEARISRIAGSMVSTNRSGPLHRHSERHPSAGSASSARRILIHAATHYLTVSSCKAHGKCHASRWTAGNMGESHASKRCAPGIMQSVHQPQQQQQPPQQRRQPCVAWRSEAEMRACSVELTRGEWLQPDIPT